MGLFGGVLDFFTGEEGNTNTQQSVSQNVDTKTKGTSSQEKAAQQKTTGTQQTEATTGQQQQVTTRLFSPEEEAALKGVLASITQSFGKSGGIVPENFINATGQAVDIGQALAERAGTAQNDIVAQIAPIISNARRTGEREIGRLNTNLASAVGSGLDSGVIGATGEARADLESKLAALEAELNIGARETQTKELTDSITALLTAGQTGGNLAAAGQTAEIGNIAEISQLLRGATSTQETTGEVTSQQTTSTEQLVSLLENIFNEYNQLTQSRTTGDSTAKTKTTQRGSLLDLLNGIGGLAAP